MHVDSEKQPVSRPFLTHRRIVLGAIVSGLGLGFAYFTIFHYMETPRAVLQHFRDADRIEFCTILPELPRGEMPEDFGYGNLDGYAIVDRVYLTNQGSTINAIAWSDRLNNNTAAGCFNPRHAIRDAVDQDNYLLICFECLQMKYRFNGETETVKISRSQAGFFEKLIEIHSMTRASDLR
jgi:hypothetical protein